MIGINTVDRLPISKKCLGFFSPLACDPSNRSHRDKETSTSACKEVNELPGRIGVPVPNAPGHHAPSRHLSRDPGLTPLSRASTSGKSERSSISPHRQYRHSTRGVPAARLLPCPLVSHSARTPSRGSAPGGSAAEGRRESWPPRGHRLALRRCGGDPRAVGPPPAVRGAVRAPCPPRSPCTSWLRRVRAPPHPRALCAPPRAPARQPNASFA